MLDEITLELARLEREALERIRRKAQEQQLGEAWEGLEPILHGTKRQEAA